MVSHERHGWLYQAYEQKHYKEGLQTFVDCKSLSCLRRSSHCLTPLVGVCWGSGAVKAWSPSETICRVLLICPPTHLKEISRDWIVFWASHSPGRCGWYQQRRQEEEGKKHIANSVSEKQSKNNSNSPLWFEISTSKIDKDRRLTGFSERSLA